MKKILVTGARGYLGHAACLVLKQKGMSPIGIDLESVSKPKTEDFPCYLTDLTNFETTRAVFEKEKTFDGIIHFAAKALVAESVEKPHVYFENNVLSTLNTVELAVKHKVPVFIQSSSCTVYGVPKTVPIPEDHPLFPISPYGETKRVCEHLLENYSSQGVRVLSLRYFNPAGSVLKGKWGESHEPETHLVPNTVSAVLKTSPIQVFGTDYATPDGSCVRDFIHVEDLIDAHLRAFEFLENNPTVQYDAINIGSGRGTSVLEIIRAAESLCKTRIEIKNCARRSGDPASLVADNSKMQKLFGWTPKRSIEDMLSDQIAWVRSQS